MGNKKLKPLLHVKNGEMKHTLEEGAPEVVPFKKPDVGSESEVHSYADEMNKIVDKKKAMDEYQKIIDDINSVRKDMWVTRSAFYKSCETVDNGVATFKHSMDYTENFIKTLESICDRFTTIVCHVEGIEVSVKLCKEDADLIIRYQNEEKSQIEQFNKELLDTQKTFFDKLNGIIAANNKIIEKTV